MSNTYETPPEHIVERINTEAKEYEAKIWEQIKDKSEAEIISRLRWALKALHKKKATEAYFESKRATEAQQALMRQIK